MTTEIMTLETINALSNKAVKAALKKEMGLIDKAKRISWEEVQNIGALSADAIKEDFASESMFAAFIGQKQQTVNKKRRILPYAERFKAWNVSPTNAFEFLPVIDNIDNLIDEDGFIDGHHVSELTQRQIREFVAAIKNPNVIPELAETEEAENNQAAPTEPENESAYNVWQLDLPTEKNGDDYTFERVDLDRLEMNQLLKAVQMIIKARE